MSFPLIARPGANDYFEYYDGYVSKVKGADLLTSLRQRRDLVADLYSSIAEDRSRYRYADGKWSIRELLGHLVDCERIMAFRALSFARGNAEPIPGMDQDDFMRHANFDDRELEDILKEFLLVRESNILMFTSLPAEAWDRRGIASGHEVTVRALGYIIAGHEIHHTDILTERYLA